MSVKSRIETSDTFKEIASLRGKIKQLSGAALIGVASIGCPGEGNEKPGLQANTSSSEQPVLSNIVTGFNAYDCQTVTVSAGYREPIIVVMKDLVDPDNTVSMSLSGEVDPVTNKLSHDYAVLKSPIDGYVTLEVFKQSDSTPVKFCHQEKTEDCIRGASKPYCTVVKR